MSNRRRRDSAGPARTLNAARRRLNLGQVKRSVVAASVAKALGRPFPPGSPAAQYKLIREFNRKTKPPPRPKIPFQATDVFLETYEWRRLRMVVLTKRGARCECCGATPKNGIAIHVDHIKPRRKYPELALEESNLQILCEVCNHGKGSWNETDWRTVGNV